MLEQAISRTCRTDEPSVNISHRLRNDASDVLCRLDKMPVGEVRVSGGGPVPPVPEQLADQGQVLT